jgi:predicted nucleic acid-binding protein
MAGNPSMANKFFLDTAFAIALISPKDAFHERALELAKQVEKNKTHLVTTRAVIIEIGNALSKETMRKSAVELIDSMEEDETIAVVPVSEEIYNDAFKIFRSRLDKEWGLTDCISFVVMKQQGIANALTADQHFQQAGFTALMK